MRFALPMAEGKLCMHFGHCEAFALIDVDDSKNILNREIVEAPPHQPGLLPGWLADMGVNTVIAGGMGVRAQDLFKAKDIDVIVGASPIDPEELVKSFLDGNLKTGENACDH